MRGVRSSAAGVPLLLAVVLAAPAGADDGQVPSAGAAPEVLCTPSDPALAELSGLAVLGGRLFATPDAGPDERIAELDSDCAVVQRFPSPVDPYDVEDMAAGWSDGRLWLADLGDNARNRQTVALVSLHPESGAGDLYRLRYPDGPQDAETLLLSADGEPVVVTKSLFGPSGIYRPAGARTVTELESPGPTDLERVGTLALGPTETAGGPIPGASSSMITGGAVSEDGTVAAVRTYTDVYLFHAPDRDIVAALLSGPDLRIAVPGEPQGEAIAFTADGDLLTASEVDSATGEQPPVRIVRGVTDLFVADSPEDAGDEELSTAVLPVVGAVAAAVVVLALAAVVTIRRRGR